MEQVKQDWDGHGTCMASKICGSDYGAAKQTIVIPVVVANSYQSIISGLELVAADIVNRRRLSPPQCIAGKTVVSMSLGFPIEDETYINTLKTTLQSIMDLGVILVNSAGNDRKTQGWKSTLYPKVLAGPDFPLILVGAVNIYGQLTDFSQLGVIYAVGQDSPCANKDNVMLPMDSDGTSGGEFIISTFTLLLPGPTSLTLHGWSLILLP